jgi:hypothetical protein
LERQSQGQPLCNLEQLARGRPLIPVLQQTDTCIGKLLSDFCFGSANQTCV